MKAMLMAAAMPKQIMDSRIAARLMYRQFLPTCLFSGLGSFIHIRKMMIPIRREKNESM
jgi:hypothetical protein